MNEWLEELDVEKPEEKYVSPAQEVLVPLQRKGLDERTKESLRMMGNLRDVVSAVSR